MDLILQAFPASSKTFWLCMANSRVGAKTSIVGDEEIFLKLINFNYIIKAINILNIK